MQATGQEVAGELLLPGGVRVGEDGQPRLPQGVGHGRAYLLGVAKHEDLSARIRQRQRQHSGLRLQDQRYPDPYACQVEAGGGVERHRHVGSRPGQAVLGRVSGGENAPVGGKHRVRGDGDHSLDRRVREDSSGIRRPEPSAHSPQNPCQLTVPGSAERPPGDAEVGGSREPAKR